MAQQLDSESKAHANSEKLAKQFEMQLAELQMKADEPEPSTARLHLAQGPPPQRSR